MVLTFVFTVISQWTDGFHSSADREQFRQHVKKSHWNTDISRYVWKCGCKDLSFEPTWL